MQIERKALPVTATGGNRSYRSLLDAVRKAPQGECVAVSRDEIKGGSDPLKRAAIRAAGMRAGLDLEVWFSEGRAHVARRGGEQGGADAEDDPEEARAWAGFWKVVTEMHDCAMKYQTLGELAESQAFTKMAFSCDDDDDDDGDGWTPERRALADRHLVLVDRAFRRMQYDPVDDPLPEEMTQLLTAFEELENWLWGHLHMSSADRYRVAQKLGSEHEPEAVYNAIRKLGETPCEPKQNDARAVALRKAIDNREGLCTALERILKAHAKKEVITAH
ncbi:MAG: hypothetical protein ACLGXA_24535 [Acidobacteriota bacterium]